jgi:4-amino-4-deoxy-L-arabinose transferase-like glycosyltransferase
MKTSFLFSLTIIIINLFYGLGSYGLLNNNEGLYAEVAREMLISGNWVIPHLNGVPYIEKPPLLYWLIATCFSIFGVSEFSARLVTTVSGFGLLWILWNFSKTYFDRKTADQSFLMLGTSLGFIAFSRMVYFDVLFAFFLTLTLTLAYRWYDSEKRHFLWGTYTALGFAILTKGFVALACVGVVGALFFALEKPGWAKIRQCFSFRGICLLFLFTAPWHIAASYQHEGFAWWYFINEHVLRFLGLREPKDYYSGPWYYYLVRMPLYIFPWTFWLPLLWQKIKHDRLINFLWAWLGGTLLFFSLSKAKANYYMVIGLPPLILWLSICLSKKWNNFGRLRRRAFYGTALFLAVFIPVILHGSVWWTQSII